VSQELLRKVTQAGMKKDIPEFRVGDTVDVACRIVEGDKERIQVFSGTVIARKGSGISEMFTVRRIVANEGVERIFPLHNPSIARIEVIRTGKTRRAKLYYLRKRIGKATRLKELAPAEADGAAASARQEPAAETAAAQGRPQAQGEKASGKKE
jgi:large subunit ribosomal protein L19